MAIGMHWNKNAQFGLAVDLIGAAMKGLVLYAVLLLTGFWGYQDGQGEFLPLFYLLIVLFTVGLAYIYHKWDGWKCILQHLFVLACWFGLSWLAKANLWSFCGIGLLAVVESLIHKFLLGDTDQRRYTKRFKSQGYLRWGVLIWVVSLLLAIQSRSPSKDYPISPRTCGLWLSVAFIAYLILVVMMKYLFQQYDYFRQRTGVDAGTFRQIKRMNGIVAVLVSILIAFSMFGMLEGLVQLFTRFLLWLSGTAIGGSIWLLTKIGTRELEDGTIVMTDSGAAEKMGREPPSEGLVQVLMGIGLVVLIAAGIYLLWKLYKNLIANYTIGKDEAVYIPKYEEKELVVQSTVKERLHFENDNRGKIRKIYYKMMNARMDKKNMEVVKGKTPKELAGMYGRPIEGNKLKHLTDYYEKARYSQEECVDADLEKVKELTET